jgi:hypothetical protein
MSSVDDRLHFGLGRVRRADTLDVTWPDGRRQVLTNIDADRLIVVRQQEATAKREGGLAPPTTERHVFEPADASAALAYKHRASAFMDYSVQPLIPIRRRGTVRHSPSVTSTATGSRTSM